MTFTWPTSTIGTPDNTAAGGQHSNGVNSGAPAMHIFGLAIGG